MPWNTIEQDNQPTNEPAIPDGRQVVVDHALVQDRYINPDILWPRMIKSIFWVPLSRGQTNVDAKASMRFESDSDLFVFALCKLGILVMDAAKCVFRDSKIKW